MVGGSLPACLVDNAVLTDSNNLSLAYGSGGSYSQAQTWPENLVAATRWDNSTTITTGTPLHRINGSESSTTVDSAQVDATNATVFFAGRVKSSGQGTAVGRFWDGFNGAMTVGNRASDWARTSDIDFGELIFLNAKLSDADIQLFEGYLAWKWGLQGSLPGGHPYKSAAPTTGYTLAAAAGSYATTGVAARTLASRLVVANVRGFNTTGIAAPLLAARKLSAAVGAYATTAIAALLAKARRLTAAAGAYATTGVAAGFRVSWAFIAGCGSFITTGGVAALNYSNAQFWTPVDENAKSWIAADDNPEIWTPVAAAPETWS
jgi:hypothetical protein